MLTSKINESNDAGGQPRRSLSGFSQRIPKAALTRLIEHEKENFHQSSSFLKLQTVLLLQEKKSQPAPPPSTYNSTPTVYSQITPSPSHPAQQKSAATHFRRVSAESLLHLLENINKDNVKHFVQQTSSNSRSGGGDHKHLPTPFHPEARTAAAEERHHLQTADHPCDNSYSSRDSINQYQEFNYSVSQDNQQQRPQRSRSDYTKTAAVDTSNSIDINYQRPPLSSSYSSQKPAVILLPQPTHQGIPPKPRDSR